MINDRFQEFYRFDEIRQLTGLAERTARRRLSLVGDSLRKVAPAEGQGRPETLFHFSALPELFAAHDRLRRGQTATPAPAPVPARDLLMAKLRCQAVQEYQARTYEMSKRQALVATCADWSHRPREESMVADLRVGNRVSREKITVSLGGFKARALQTWVSLYKDSGNLLDLVDGRRGAAGRPRKENIPEDLLDAVHSLAISTPRANIQIALTEVKRYWPGKWPAISDKTILRRIRERDPHQKFDALGKSGTSRFNLESTPDIMTDWNALRWNQLWILDDNQEDWYASVSEEQRLLRPYVYRIIRACTRQTIYLVTSPTPIVQEQVRSIIGLAMADPACGVPELILFERGTVACDGYLEDLLETLGVKVKRTGMSEGATHAGAVPDRGVGKFQSKALVERSIRTTHDANALLPTQVGGEERHTAKQNFENLKALAEKSAEQGRFLKVPGPQEWPNLVRAAIEKVNNAPNRGLPEIVDPATGAVRHMTPNERARYLIDEAVRVMPQAMLPLFFSKSYRVPVKKNGIYLNKTWYGWGDQELSAIYTRDESPHVTVFALSDNPEIVYCETLGRVLEAYAKPAYGEAGAQHGRKLKVAKAGRNQFEDLKARAAGMTDLILDASRSSYNPTPARRTVALATDETLNQRLQSIDRGVEDFKALKTRMESRFDFDSIPDRNGPEAGGGIVARTAAMREQVAALAGSENPNEDEEDDIFNVF